MVFCASVPAMWRNLRTFWGFGIFALLGNAVSLAIYHILTQRLASDESHEPVSVSLLLATRQFCIFALGMPFVSYTNTSMFRWNRKTWLLQCVRITTALAASAFGQLAIQRVVLPDFATIQAITPLATTLISWPLTKQAPRVTDIPIFVGCLIGVVFVVQPDFIFGFHPDYSPPDLLGVTYSFLVVFTNIGVFISLRELRHVPLPPVVALYGLGSFFIAIAFHVVFVRQLPPCDKNLRLGLLAVGIVAFLQICFDVLSAKALPAGFIALAPVIEIVFHVKWQVFVVQNVPHVYTLVGAGIVIAFFCFYAFRTYLTYKTETIQAKDVGISIPRWIKILTC